MWMFNILYDRPSNSQSSHLNKGASSAVRIFVLLSYQVQKTCWLFHFFSKNSFLVLLKSSLFWLGGFYFTWSGYLEVISSPWLLKLKPLSFVMKLRVKRFCGGHITIFCSVLQVSPPPLPCVSHVTYHVPHFTCQVSGVTCHVLDELVKLVNGRSVFSCTEQLLKPSCWSVRPSVGLSTFVKMWPLQVSGWVSEWVS